MAIHLAFKVFFQLWNTLAGDARKNIQQVGDARFLFQVVTNDRRLFGVGHRAFDLLDHGFRIFQQANHVVTVIVRLGHLLRRLEQRHHARTRLRNKRLRHFEHVAINGVETLGNIAAQFKVLLLIFANRYLVSLIQQNVCRHQHRIVKQTGVDVFRVAGGFILELGHAAQLAEIGVAVQRPAQLSVFRHVRLYEDGAFFRVDAAGQIQSQRVERRFTQRLRVLADGNRMLVHDAVDAVIVILHVDPLTQCTHVVTDGQFT